MVCYFIWYWRISWGANVIRIVLQAGPSINSWSTIFFPSAPSVSKKKRGRIGQKATIRFRPVVDLQGKITPDPQLHMDPQIIPAPRRPWKISHFWLTLQGRKKWCERVSMPKFLQCRKLTLPHEIQLRKLFQSCSSQFYIRFGPPIKSSLRYFLESND